MSLQRFCISEPHRWAPCASESLRPIKRSSGHKPYDVVAFSWPAVGRRPTSGAKDETETGLAENQTRPFGSGPCVRRNRSAAIDLRLTSLSYGVVRSLACPSTRQLSPVTGFTLKIAGLAMGTTNVRLASVRRLADEAAGCRPAERRACGRYPQGKRIQPAGKMDQFRDDTSDWPLVRPRR
jgi:hypothetical protein